MYRNSRVIAFISIVLSLTGCVTTGDSSSMGKDYTNEQLLVSSGNHQELVKLYKQQLLVKDDVDTRIKLVRAYIDVKDYESAIFNVQPLLNRDQVTADTYFLYGKALFGLNEKDKAREVLRHAIKLNPNHGEALNLLGVIAANSGDYIVARQRFIQARQRMFDDVTVKNNLAMVDLIEGRYESAVEKLTPLLSMANPSEKVKSNLALAYAKLGRFEQFCQLLNDSKLTKADTKEIYDQLVKIEVKEFSGPPKFLAGDSKKL
jgi:tight adherence protein D